MVIGEDDETDGDGACGYMSEITINVLEDYSQGDREGPLSTGAECTRAGELMHGQRHEEARGTGSCMAIVSDLRRTHSHADFWKA